MQFMETSPNPSTNTWSLFHGIFTIWFQANSLELVNSALVQASSFFLCVYLGWCCVNTQLVIGRCSVSVRALSVPPRKFSDSTSIWPWPRPSKSFWIHHSPYHSTLYSLDTAGTVKYTPLLVYPPPSYCALRISLVSIFSHLVCP
jgi:hypothetical protein